MRISTSNLASMAGIQGDLKSAFSKSASMQRAIWDFKASIGGLTQDVFALSKKTSMRKRDLGAMNLWSRMWQAIQSLVSTFREKLNRLLAYVDARASRLRPAVAKPFDNAKRFIKAEKAVQSDSLNPAAMTNLYSAKGVGRLRVKSSADAELAVQNLVHALPPNLSQSEIVSYLQGVVARGRYSATQLSWLYQAIHRQGAMTTAPSGLSGIFSGGQTFVSKLSGLSHLSAFKPRLNRLG